MLHATHHHPPHRFLNNSFYFITARTVNANDFLCTNKHKNLWISCLKAGLRKTKTILYAWILLNNHYHLLIKSKNNLSQFINLLNGRTSYELNKLDNTLGRKIWYQYWDHCVRDEADFYKHLNYIHQNPIKHGLVKNLNNLKNYRFSSYNDWIKKKGVNWIVNCFEKFPIKDFVEKSERSAG